MNFSRHPFFKSSRLSHVCSLDVVKMFVFGTAKVSQPNIVPKAFHLPGVADLRAWLVLLILSRKSSVG